MNSTPQILDPCCGGKMLWFNKNDRRAVFCDRRREKHILCDGRVFEVNPDTVCDFRKLPFPDESFFLICFDPPHLLQAGETSWIKKKYGSLNRLTWSEDLSKGFDECWRVLKPGGTLTNAARDLAQFSARFGTCASIVLAHCMQRARRKISRLSAFRLSELHAYSRYHFWASCSGTSPYSPLSDSKSQIPLFNFFARPI